MAVIFADLTFQSGISTSVNDKGWITASATITWNVFVDSPLDNEATVKASNLIPYEKSGHPYFLFLFCNGVNITRKNPLHFEVVANYESAPYQDSQDPQNPLNQPTDISFGTITSDEEVSFAYEVTPFPPSSTPTIIQNTAGDRVSGITRPISDMSITLTKNFATFDPASFYTYIDSVNEDTYLGFPPGVLKIMSISADQEFYDQLPYYKVTVQIAARKPYHDVPPAKAWWTKIVSEGLRACPQAGQPSEDLFTESTPTQPKIKINEPKKLKQDGTVYPDAQQATEAYYQYIKLFESRNFASMGF